MLYLHPANKKLQHGTTITIHDLLFYKYLHMHMNNKLNIKDYYDSIMKYYENVFCLYQLVCKICEVIIKHVQL